jgi:hypothetical protein
VRANFKQIERLHSSSQEIIDPTLTVSGFGKAKEAQDQEQDQATPPQGTSTSERLRENWLLRAWPLNYEAVTRSEGGGFRIGVLHAVHAGPTKEQFSHKDRIELPRFAKFC